MSYIRYNYEQSKDGRFSWIWSAKVFHLVNLRLEAWKLGDICVGTRWRRAQRKIGNDEWRACALWQPKPCCHLGNTLQRIWEMRFRESERYILEILKNTIVRIWEYTLIIWEMHFRGSEKYTLENLKKTYMDWNKRMKNLGPLTLSEGASSSFIRSNPCQTDSRSPVATQSAHYWQCECPQTHMFLQNQIWKSTGSLV